MKMLLSALLNAFHVDYRRPEKPLDLVQMEAAKDRLAQRGEQLEEEVDELSKMVRRMRRRDQKQ